MNNLFLIRGLPGSGKSTLASTLAEWDGEKLFMYAADDYFYSDGVYNFNPSKLPAAHAQCQERCDNAMKNGASRIAIHNTFVCRWEMQVYLTLADTYGYRVTVVSVFDGGLDDKELFVRNTHGVPLNAITRMRANYEHDWKLGNPLPPWERK